MPEDRGGVREESGDGIVMEFDDDLIVPYAYEVMPNNRARVSSEYIA